MQNALISYVSYVGKALWPSGLAVFYPHPKEAVSLPASLLAGLLLVALTAFAIRFSERLLEQSVFVTGFGYPVVPEGTARVRVQMSAALDATHLERALQAFVKVGRELGLVDEA